MWVQATCKAFYFDSEGEEQEIELTHWVTGLSDEEINRINRQNEMMREYYSEKGYDPVEIDRILKGEKAEGESEIETERRPVKGPFSF
jgi:hypothetical protein